MPGDRQRATVCAVCWHASNHRPSPQLTTGPPDAQGRCLQCRLPWKTVNLVFVGRTKKWVEIRPRPSGVTSAFKVCEYVQRKDGAACPNRNKCTFAHSRAELEEWQRDRDASSTSRIRPPNTERSKLCVYYVNGRCVKDDCTFPHQFTRCDHRFNGVGFCTRDANCPYAHSAKELQAWNNWLARTPTARDGATPGDGLEEAVDKTFYCEHCKVSCSSGRQLQEHFKSQQHLSVMRSAAKVSPKPAGQKYREAPRNVFGEYRMCRFIASGRRCDFGDSACTFAHSEGELQAWRAQRSHQGGQQSGTSPQQTPASPQLRTAHVIKAAPQKHALSSTFSEATVGILATIAKGSASVDKMLVADSEGGWAHGTVSIEEINGTPLVCRSTTPDKLTWVFQITCTEPQKMHAMFLDPTFPHFKINRVEAGPVARVIREAPCSDAVLRPMCFQQQGYVNLHVTCKPTGFGVYSQVVVFKFASGYVARQIRVHVMPNADEMQLAALYADLQQLSIRRNDVEPWDMSSVAQFPVIQGDPDYTSVAEDIPNVGEEDLFSEAVAVSNYRSVMHAIATCEQRERSVQLSRLSLSNVALMPINGAPRGEVWLAVSSSAAAMDVCKYLDVGDVALIKPQAASRVLSAINAAQPSVVQALVAQTQFNSLVFRVDVEAAPLLSSGNVDIRLTPNNKRFRRMRRAIDTVLEAIVFPKPHGPQSRTLIPLFDEKLNPEQVQAIHLAAGENALPGVYMVRGPAATGKTRLVLEVIKQCFSGKRKEHILLCAGADEDADALAKLVAQHGQGIVVYRLFEPGSCSAVSIPPPVRTNFDAAKGVFVLPQPEQMAEQDVIVTTRVVAGALADCGVSPGAFGLVIIDDCSQGCEAEVLVPLSLMNSQSRCLLLGDPNQSPAARCGGAAGQAARRSIISRISGLSGWKTSDASNCVDLVRNYSANAPLLQLASGFYKNKLSCMAQPDIPGAADAPFPAARYPLAFVAVQGDSREIDGHLINKPEASELVRQVRLLVSNWPSTWPALKLEHVGVCVPEPAQAASVRLLLDAAMLSDIKVELPTTASRHCFRVLFVSTVVDIGVEDKFTTGNSFCDASTLCTVLMRASSIVVMVGNPLVLCSTGKDKACWQRIVQQCRTRGTLMFHSAQQVEDLVELHARYKSIFCKGRASPIDADLGMFPGESALQEGALLRHQQLHQSENGQGEYTLPASALSAWGYMGDPMDSHETSSIGSGRSWSSSGVPQSPDLEGSQPGAWRMDQPSRFAAEFGLNTNSPDFVPRNRHHKDSFGISPSTQSEQSVGSWGAPGRPRFGSLSTTGTGADPIASPMGSEGSFSYSSSQLGLYPEYLESQSTALLEHRATAREQLAMTVPTSPLYRNLKNQLKLIDEQWVLLEQQRSLYQQQHQHQTFAHADLQPYARAVHSALSDDSSAAFSPGSTPSSPGPAFWNPTLGGGFGGDSVFSS